MNYRLTDKEIAQEIDNKRNNHQQADVLKAIANHMFGHGFDGKGLRANEYCHEAFEGEAGKKRKEQADHNEECYRKARKLIMEAVKVLKSAHRMTIDK
jgi:hypothetical protein